LPPPAGATITRLCTGYTACANAGMSHAGYAQVNGQMYWRMYSGHNCTNYAAYRMVRSGLPNERPWSGSGNASNWGYAMDHITNQRPRVGAIAWWKAYAPGAGSAGHLGYVEKVISPTEIIISQDSWGGDFSWARITAEGSGWPSGFIHFNDVPMTSTARPVITGTPRTGQTLTTTGGSWDPSDPALTYRWKADGAGIVGATSSSYTLQQADQGKRITVTVQATKMGYPRAWATSAPTEPVQAAQMTATSAPSVSGTPVVDGTLSAVAPTWNVEPDVVRYQWLSAGAPVAGATGVAFLPGPQHVGTRIRLRVTAAKQGYDPVTVTSPATGPVAEGTLVRETLPAVAGPPRIGQPLTLDPGVVSPEGTVTVQWLRDGAPIPDAIGTTYLPTADDLGTRLSAQVTHARDGYTTITAVSGETRPVKSPVTLDVTHSIGRRGAVRLRAAATAPAVVPVTGEVVLRKGRRALGRAPLVDGVARFVVSGLRSGTHHLVLRLPGTATTTRARVVRIVEVP
ncbi:MAG TPA: CHAP domain-containing protein, partial [Nocardioides sp.]